jgi:hypothetical protein
VTIGRQQLKILRIGRAPSSFKYYLKANGGRTIIFGVTEYKYHQADIVGSPGGDRAIDFLIGRFFVLLKQRPI